MPKNTQEASTAMQEFLLEQMRDKCHHSRAKREAQLRANDKHDIVKHFNFGKFNESLNSLQET